MANEAASGAMFYDAEKISALSTFFSDKYTSLNQLKIEFDSLVDNLSNVWKGEAYDAFKLYVSEFDKNQFEPILKEITSWSKKFADLAENASNNTTANVNIFS